MVYHEFPDLTWLKKRVEENFASKTLWEGQTVSREGWPTVILNVQTQNICRDNIRGPLTIFSNISGKSEVEVDKRRVTVKDDCFFVSNNGQHYTLQVGKQVKAQTFNIHFGETLLAEVFASKTSSAEFSLDGGDSVIKNNTFNFYNKLHRKSSAFDMIVREISQYKHDRLKLEEKLFELAVLLLSDHHQLKRIEKSLPPIKHATRQELVKRLLASADFIHSHFHHDLSLEDLAKISCLSKFHYLRLFKLVFGNTPHQFLNQVRTDHAKFLLKDRRLEVNAIAKLVGFQDTSSFSRMFFNSTGWYPSQFRANQ